MEFFVEIDKLRGDVNLFDPIYLSRVEIPARNNGNISGYSLKPR
jgi:hypothetical protein